MINGKIGGFVFGGLAGFLLINKVINFLDNSVSNICSAAKWKAYYKNCKDPLVVPPGYASSTRPINDHEEVVVEDPNAGRQEQKKENAEKIVEAVKDAVKDIAKDIKEDRNAAAEDERDEKWERRYQEAKDFLKELDEKAPEAQDNEVENNDQTVD